MDIQNEHMKHRCYFLAVICGGSLYNIYNYSSYDPTINNLFSIPYLHCLFTAYYFLWDTYEMVRCKELFRTELLLHHVVASFELINLMYYFALQTSCFMIVECISLMNVVWRDKPLLLKIYRTLCIFCVRIPSALYWGLYYDADIDYQYLLETISIVHYNYLRSVQFALLLLVFYDMYILYQLYKPKKIKA